MERIMRKLMSLVVSLLVPLSLLAAEDADDAKTLNSKITEVNVYADRARVTRVASVNLGGAMTKVAFRKLPGWLDEGSVRLAITPADAGELVDVQIARTFLARPDDDEIRQAEAAVRELADQMAGLDDERAVLDAQSRQVDAIRAFSLEKLPKDTAAREVKVEEYVGVVQFVGNTLRDVSKAKRELDKKRRDLQPELTARQRKLDELRQRAQLEQRTVIVTLKGRAGKPAMLSLTYMLPGATWEPVHELRAVNGAKEVTLASFGVLTQTTGEDWEGVTLSLSTQRSTDTIKIPELEKLLVGGSRPLPKLITSSGESFKVAAGKFTSQISMWNRYANADAPAQQAEFTDNWGAQQLVQTKNIERFERLQEQRGTTAHFTGVGAQTVRTDGRALRVPIGAAQLAAQPKIVAAPEISLNAARTAELVNTGRQPLLPGKVLLYLEGAFLGATEVDFVAPGEGFPMFMGVADQIKLSRTLDKKRSALSWSGKRTRMQVSYVVSAENLADKEASLELADRVPVSETDEIRVTNVKITPVIKPDNKGLIKWDAKLPAKQSQDFRLEYTLDYPADLLQRAVPAPTGNAAAMQSMTEPAAANELHQRIGKLEEMLKK
jgi:uncharacterized protein (TIGR02231 family)